jgi:hypothetical protein
VERVGRDYFFSPSGGESGFHLGFVFVGHLGLLFFVEFAILVSVIFFGHLFAERLLFGGHFGALGLVATFFLGFIRRVDGEREGAEGAESDE